MIRIYLRSADHADLRATAPPGTTISRNFLLGSLPVAVALFGLVYVFSRSLVIAGGLAASVFAASAASNIRHFREVARRATQGADPRAVEVIEVAASRVWDIEPVGSHGPAFVFFASGGKGLLLIGQWLLEQPSFPALAFRVHRWSDSGRPIRIETSGPQIAPEHSTVRVPSSSRVPDIVVLDAMPETLQRDLDRAFGGSRPTP